MDLKVEIEQWLKETGIDQLQPYDTGEITWAINVGKDLADMEPNKIDAAMLILSNYRLTVSYLMGLCFARVKYLEVNGPRDQLTLCRAKLNIIKPWHEAIEAKIAVIKKIYDRKMREATNASGGRR